MVLRRVLPAVVCACAVLLSGCGGDGDKGAEGSAPSTSPTPGPSEPGSPTQSETPDPYPGVEPADGRELQIDFVTLRVPKGWRTEEFVDNHQTASDTNSFSMLQLRQAGPVQPHPLRKQVKDSLEGHGVPTLERREDVTVAGQEFYRIAGKDYDDTWLEEYGTIHREQIVVIGFSFDPGLKPARRQRIMESVFATWEWND